MTEAKMSATVPESLQVCRRCSQEIVAGDRHHDGQGQPLCRTCHSSTSRPLPSPVVPLLSRRINPVYAAVCGLIGLALLCAVFAPPKVPVRPTEPDNPPGFSAWDGSNSDLVKQTKARLHDPASFEHVKTTLYQQPTRNVVLMSYRAKNALGATVLESVKAECDPQGRVIRFE